MKKEINLLALKEEIRESEKKEASIQKEVLIHNNDSITNESIFYYQKAEREANIERLRIENEDLRQRLNIQREIHILEQQRLMLENTTRNLSNEDIKFDVQERKKYARRIFSLLCVWVFVVLMIIIINGSNLLNFHLNDTVLIVMIGDSAVNIAGFFIVVVRYMVPEKNVARK